MALLSERDREVVRKYFAENIKSKVTLNFFTQSLGCETCAAAELVVREIADLSADIELKVFNPMIDKDVAARFGIDRVPALVITGEKEYGVRYFGTPAGHEFRTLMEDIADVSRGDSGLQQETREVLQALDRKVHLLVFVTPTCPYCPQMVRLAHKAAIESNYVTADMIEAMEFPDLSARYEVMGVPKTILNDQFAIEGALPEPAFAKWLKEALKQDAAIISSEGTPH
ncbi:MAG: protein disulfide oxidoreductase [bacterium JZ-2024 1]